MSSFIPSAKHFNSIEASLIAIYPHLTKEFVSAKMDDLRRLTATCVTLQYAHHYENVEQEIKDEIENLYSTDEHVILPNETALLKILGCLNYQIELNHLENIRPLTSIERDSFNWLSNLINKLESKGLDKTAEYNDFAYCL